MTVADTIPRRRFFSFSCPAGPGRLPLTNQNNAMIPTTNYIHIHVL
jgi:hypothetical protein